MKLIIFCLPILESKLPCWNTESWGAAQKFQQAGRWRILVLQLLVYRCCWLLLCNYTVNIGEKIYLKSAVLLFLSIFESLVYVFKVQYTKCPSLLINLKSWNKIIKRGVWRFTGWPRFCKWSHIVRSQDVNLLEQLSGVKKSTQILVSRRVTLI